MRILESGRHRRPHRFLVAAGVSAVALVAVAAPALGHASIPSSSAFGFAPNPSGGTGATGSTPPYAPGSTQTITVRAPWEGSGENDTTIDLKVVVPDGWTGAVGGAAKTSVNTAATNNTNQPGADVPGWSVATETAFGRTVLHWSGPVQASVAASPQFFVLTVKVPSPAMKTTYDGTNGTEGFIVDQTYSLGEKEHWIPSAGFVGNPPAGSITTVATGLARTVAGTAPTASGSGATQVVTAVIGSVAPPTEEFALTIPTNPGIAVTAGSPTADYFPFTGQLNNVTIKDTRSAKPAWSVSGQVGDFTGPAAATTAHKNGKALGWTPTVVTAGAGAIAGAAVPSGTPTGNGLKTSSTLASAPAGHDLGEATLGAALDLRLPVTAPAGTYTATITLTAI